MSRYEEHGLENMELPFIYRESAVRPIKRVNGSSNRMLSSSNWHENIEILYVVGGEGVIFHNGHVLSVQAGDIAVISTNQLHSLAAGEEPLLHRYLIIDRSFGLANGIDTNTVSFDARIEDAELRELMEQLHEAYRMQEDSLYRTPTIRSLVLRILVLLCTAHGTPVVGESELQDRSVSYVKQAIAYVRASYEKSFSLDDVAAFVGVSKCYLSREFHKYTGYPFVAYVNRMRCKIAKSLLSDERLSISEVGKRCGFDNRSYFAKCFYRYVGILPAEYRIRIRKEENGGG